MIRALFVSGLARTRGPTAAQVFGDWPGVRADFAGIEPGADARLSAEQLDWADRIYCFEPRQKTRISDLHGRHLRGRTVYTLDVPDLYTFMQPELIDLLVNRVGPDLKNA